MGIMNNSTLMYKFANIFKYMFSYNHELYETKTCCYGMIHMHPTCNAGVRNVVRDHIPDLLLGFPINLMGKVRTRSNYGMFIICMRHVFLSFNISPVKIKLALSLLSQK